MGYVVSVAQLDRVSASDAEGCGFDPRRIRHKKSCLFGGFFYGIKNRGIEPERARADRKPPVEVFVASGAVFLFEREAAAPRSEIRKQAGDPRRIRHKKDHAKGGLFFMI